MDRSNPRDERTTVLVVDDEQKVADLYADHLADDYDVRTAYSGTEALEAVDGTVDVVLLDRRMPDLSGDEVLAEIRDRNVDCRVVMVTAIKPYLDIVELDFDDYLVKPVSAEILEDAVERMVARDALDGGMQEILRVATKMATLESKMDVEELEASSEYAALERQFTELKNSLDATAIEDDLYAEFATEKVEAVFESLATTSRDAGRSEE